MKPRKRALAVIGAALLGILAVILLAGCNNTRNSNSTEHDAANAGINLVLKNQPVPIFPSSQQRADEIEIQAIMALGSATTTFFFPEGTTVVNGKFSAPPFKACPSEGEPIPNTASLTNPLQKVSNADAVVEQMDPVGIYTPAASSGTYVLCDTASGQQKLDYWEGPVETETGTAAWDAATGQIQDIGSAMLPVCSIVSARDGDGTNLQAGTKYYQCVKAAGDSTKGVQTKADYTAAS